jgi:hypothetical protein
MRQQIQRRLAVADEIVVDEIDRVGHAAFAQLVELGDDLLRRLQARIAAVEAGDVAELALIGTAARILDAAEQIFSRLGELIGRNRKVVIATRSWSSAPPAAAGRDGSRASRANNSLVASPSSPTWR